ncbi:hypothetical protein [Baekduia sp. Peel2402]|uniref:hypothetical protein n=1 Tax=Baekduia sp. Peel2402 TaxID=3458296 RepID=UPI00403E8FEB
MNRDVASVTALAAAGAMLIGCGGSNDAAPGRAEASPSPAAATQTVDAQLAHAALLRANDLSDDWAADPGSRRTRCRSGGTFAGVVGHDASQSFTRGNVNIQQTVWLFEDAAAARRAWRAMNAPDGRACFQLQVSTQVRDQGSEFTRDLRPVQQRRTADGLRRSVLTGQITRIADGPLGPVQTQMALKVHEVERLHGRGISTIVMVGAAEEPDPDTARWLVTLAGRRLASVIAAARPVS